MSQIRRIEKLVFERGKLECTIVRTEDPFRILLSPTRTLESRQLVAVILAVAERQREALEAREGFEGLTETDLAEKLPGIVPSFWSGLRSLWTVPRSTSTRRLKTEAFDPTRSVTGKDRLDTLTELLPDPAPSSVPGEHLYRVGLTEASQFEGEIQIPELLLIGSSRREGSVEESALRILERLLKEGFVEEKKLAGDLGQDAHIVTSAIDRLTQLEDIAIAIEESLPGEGRSSDRLLICPALVRPAGRFKIRVGRHGPMKLAVAQRVVEKLKELGDPGCVWISGGGTNLLIALEMNRAHVGGIDIVTNAPLLGTLLRNQARITFVAGDVDSGNNIIRVDVGPLECIRDPRLSIMGVDRWSYDAGCQCSVVQREFQEALWRRLPAGGHLLLVSDAGELERRKLNAFMTFDDLKERGIEYWFYCGMRGFPQDVRETALKEGEKFPGGRFIPVE